MMYGNKLAAAIKVNGKVLREFKDTVYIPFGEIVISYASFEVDTLTCIDHKSVRDHTITININMYDSTGRM